MSKTQSALLLTAPHGQFSVSSIPIETPGPGEILIKVHSAALNPVDWKIQKYDYCIDGYPAVLGSDIAGEVFDLGQGVGEFEKGDKVFCQSEFKKTRGGFQQYVVALAARVSKIPPNLSYDDASTLPMALTTAYSGMFSPFPTGLGLDSASITQYNTQEKGKYAGTPFLVLGGSSSIGQFVIQLAKLAGFSPIITTSSSAHHASLKDLGATHVIDRSLPSHALNASIASITSTHILFAFDCVAIAETQHIAIENLAPGGRAILAQPLESSVTEGRGLDGREVGMAIASVNMPHNMGFLEPFYHDVVYAFLEDGRITPNRVEVLPNGLAGIVDGLKRLEAEQVSRLKLVAHPQDPED